MTKPRLQIKKLSFLSPSKEPATVDFLPGLNIVHGASDTGKSFTLDAIDFVLGASSPLKDIPQRVGYEKVVADFSVSNAEDIHIERGIDGGDLLVTDGNGEQTELSQKHNPKREDNISKYLLSLIELVNYEIKMNAGGKKRGVSFRDLSDLIIIREGIITKETSPVLSGQFTTATPEKSLFKLLLTGIDDSAFVSAKKPKVESVNLQLIDQLILEYKADLEDELPSVNEIQDQLKKLEVSIDDQNDAVDSIQGDLQESLRTRNELVEKKEFALSRLDEVETLLERFGLLDKHYSNDLKRLDAIKESGVLLSFIESKNCPLCGSAPENHNHDQSCDGDIKSVIDAAAAEMLKILQLKNELRKTVDEIKTEQKSRKLELKKYDDQFDQIQKKVAETLAPSLAENQSKFSDLVKKRYEVNRTKEILQKIAALEEKRGQYSQKERGVPSTVADTGNVSKSVLGDFSQKVEDLLTAWGFPNASRVYFDEAKFDIVIANKPRGSSGKGLRAITHAAFSIALLEYCVSKDLPHPGFIIMDSPLLAYKEPEPGNENIEKTDLKDRFYRYLANMGKDYQIIICENVAPPDDLEDANIIRFTGNSSVGRYGLFPHLDEVDPLS